MTKRVLKVSTFLGFWSSFYSDLQNVQMPEKKLDNVLILFLIKTCLEQKSCADLHFRPFYQGSEHLSLTFRMPFGYEFWIAGSKVIHWIWAAAI